MASFSLFAYSRHWFMRQSGIRSVIRTTSKTWTHPLVCITAPTSNSEISRRQIWARDYASKKGPDKNRGKKALDDFLEEFDDDEDEEAFKRGSEVAGGKETAVAKFVRECQSGKGKARGKKESKGMRRREGLCLLLIDRLFRRRKEGKRDESQLNRYLRGGAGGA